jgi:hypothetical protein
LFPGSQRTATHGRARGSQSQQYQGWEWKFQHVFKTSVFLLRPQRKCSENLWCFYSPTPLGYCTVDAPLVDNKNPGNNSTTFSEVLSLVHLTEPACNALSFSSEREVSPLFHTPPGHCKVVAPHVNIHDAIQTFFESAISLLGPRHFSNRVEIYSYNLPKLAPRPHQTIDKTVAH